MMVLQLVFGANATMCVNIGSILLYESVTENRLAFYGTVYSLIDASMSLVTLAFFQYIDTNWIYIGIFTLVIVGLGTIGMIILL